MADISTFKEFQNIEFRIIGYSPQVFSFKELEQQEFLVSLSPTYFSIDQVVVSATRWRQPSFDVPVRIKSVSSKQIAYHNPQTAADLLSITGDVFIQKSQQGGGSPMIRGFATNRLLIAVDGVRMNNAIFRSGNIQNVISLDPFAIDRTEVLFGASSVIYGSDAIGGVMNFYTLAPKHSEEKEPLVFGNVSSRYSSANSEKTGHIDLNIGWEKWAVLSSFSYTNFGNLRMGSFGPKEYLLKEFVKRQGDIDVVVPNPNPKEQLPTAYNQSNFMQKISYKPNTRWSVSYGLHYSASSEIDRYDRLISYKDGLPRSAEWYYGPQIWVMNNLNIVGRVNAKLFDNITLNIAHQQFKESRSYRNFNSPTLSSKHEEVAAVSANIDFSKSLGARQKIFYGVESVYNKVNSMGFEKNIITKEVENAPARYPISDWRSYAAYLTYQHKLTDKLNLQAGGRYNRFLLNAIFDRTFYPLPFSEASINKGAVTGSVGITLRPASNWRLTSNLSTGFRSPNVDDLGKIFDSTPGSVTVPNPNLNAEYAYNAEVSVTRVFDNFLEIDFLVFATLLDNAMVRRDGTFNGQDSIYYDGELSRVQMLQNAANAKVWGFQADFELKFSSRFVFSSRFNYQKGVEELEDGSTSPLRHAAPWFGVATLSYNYNRLRVDFFANYSGNVLFANLAQEEREKPYIYAIDTNGNPYSPSWTTLNLRARFQFSTILSSTIAVENLTDIRYRPYSSGMVSPGLNFVASVRLSF
jgi:hemoglobin/transferrin/lactoferrin receptor protein